MIILQIIGAITVIFLFAIVIYLWGYERGFKDAEKRMERWKDKSGILHTGGKKCSAPDW